MLLQATAVCAIAWQQALPEALVSSQVETDSALKQHAEIRLWMFNNGIGKLRRRENLDNQNTFQYKSKQLSLWSMS